MRFALLIRASGIQQYRPRYRRLRQRQTNATIAGFDHNNTAGLKMGSSSHDVFFTGGSFQNDGVTGTTGNEEHVLLARTSTNPMNLHFTGTYFSNYQGTPNYVFESSTAGANADYLYVDGGDGLNGYEVSYFNWTAGAPQHLSMNTTGTGKINGVNSLRIV